MRSPTIRSTPRGFISQNPLQQGTGSSLSFAFQEGKLTVSAFPSSTRLSIASGKNKGAKMIHRKLFLRKKRVGGTAMVDVRMGSMGCAAADACVSYVLFFTE